MTFGTANSDEAQCTTVGFCHDFWRQDWGIRIQTKNNNLCRCLSFPETREEFQRNNLHRRSQWSPEEIDAQVQADHTDWEQLPVGRWSLTRKTRLKGWSGLGLLWPPSLLHLYFTVDKVNTNLAERIQPTASDLWSSAAVSLLLVVGWATQGTGLRWTSGGTSRSKLGCDQDRERHRSCDVTANAARKQFAQNSLLKCCQTRAVRSHSERLSKPKLGLYFPRAEKCQTFFLKVKIIF